MTLDENVKGIDQLNNLVQKHAEETLQSKWKVDDVCLVYCSIPLATDGPEKKWIRGKISELNAAQNSVTCFLSDYGHKVKVELNSLMEMPEKFDKVLDGATKCHLSSCVPTGKKLKDIPIQSTNFRSFRWLQEIQHVCNRRILPFCGQIRRRHCSHSVW